MSSTKALRESICRVGRLLYERGYVHATAGNISARCDEGFLITPTDACLGMLDPAALAFVDAQGQQRDGERASKTLALHLRIYAADASAHCVLHTHSTNLVALTLEGVWSGGDIVPTITPYFVMKVGHVPLIEYHRPGDPRVAELVAARIAAAAARGAPLQYSKEVWASPRAVVGCKLHPCVASSVLTAFFHDFCFLPDLPCHSPCQKSPVRGRISVGSRWRGFSAKTAFLSSMPV